MDKFADKLKQLRTEHGYTQEDLAKFLYCAKQSIVSWETKRSLPSFVMIISLAKFFHVTSDYLLGLTE